MASSITAPNAIDALFAAVDGFPGHHVMRFERNGREYFRAPGCVSFSTDDRGDYAIVPVFPMGRPMRKLKIRATDKLRVLSCRAAWDPEHTEVFV